MLGWAVLGTLVWPAEKLRTDYGRTVGRPAPLAAHTGPMQIILDITQDAGGRLSGTAGTAGETRVLTFSGTMELLARIEELCAESLCQARAPRSGSVTSRAG